METYYSIDRLFHLATRKAVCAIDALGGLPGAERILISGAKTEISTQLNVVQLLYSYDLSPRFERVSPPQ